MVRRAQKKDINKLLELLKEVLETHASIRPDVFVSNGSPKYTYEELETIIKDDTKPIYVYVNKNDEVLGHMFIQFKEAKKLNHMKSVKTFFIDDFCVDKKYRGKNIAKELFDFAKEEAKKYDCQEIALVAWEGNERAMRFYEKMGMKIKTKTFEYNIKK